MSNTLRKSALALATFAVVACSDPLAPLPPFDANGLTADMAAVSSAGNAAATLSLNALGDEIDGALGSSGGALGIAELPSFYLKDPVGTKQSTQAYLRIAEQADQPAVIPAAAMGKTFTYDVNTHAYVMSERTGAPANGVRFILYAVDPVTQVIVEPLVETGWVDITRTESGSLVTARVQAYSGGENAVKVMDYTAKVETDGVPTATVEGFARNGTDSLTFRLRTSISIATGKIAVNWHSEVPTRGFEARVIESLDFGNESLRVGFDGLLKSQNGQVTMFGVVDTQVGGTLTVKVNREVFARIEFAGGLESEPVVTDAGGEPLTEQEIGLLHEIFEWFSHAFDFFNQLLAPVDSLVSPD